MSLSGMRELESLQLCTPQSLVKGYRSGTYGHAAKAVPVACGSSSDTEMPGLLGVEAPGDLTCPEMAK